MLVEQDLSLELLPNGGWDSRIEVVQVGDLVRSHLIYTENFTVVYDTLLGPLSGAFLAGRVAERGKPVLVVDSHSDWDHYWGNQCFSGPILGLQLTAERILGRFGREELVKKSGEHPSYRAVKLVPPNVRLSGETVLDGGDLTLQLLHTPGHRPDHLALYIPEIRTLLPGDAVETPFALLDESSPSEDLKQMQSTLQRFLALDVDWLLCNHAPPQAGKDLVRSNLEFYRRLVTLADLSDSVESLMRQFPYEGPEDADFYRQDHARICKAAWAAAHP
ncbi:MBL fold metallo-hydrolase [bacterium]|nr:MBL fold metallo-hydrolase [bacterium]